ncbi:MAG TPA: nitrophenyl compound nitroreductase subunit ArsF family protein [Candidatus Krumholzibacteria bacterium]|nr:nitrophenyl compound nitroreductase subunit ArsF family protein [Candidatus Krumholzibacteria bacterium]HPD70623.1 nitrophenyl compound nitroreductase subunit ArsF family protein [Candidatus Krumholzibacteria bacterium]HRY39677.1 nitrophenyl compound nitroreductase subunit ArsF family protein [Candidatus Krumholzibacteria bacterium]
MTCAHRLRLAVVQTGLALVLAVLAAARETAPGAAAAADSAAAAADGAAAAADSAASTAPAFTIYYFHGTYRCESCLRIEAWTEEAVRREFAREIESGLVDWLAIDAQEDANAHYAARYQLTSQAVILAAWRDGEVARWKSLDDVWGLLQAKDEFQDYIRREIVAFMGPER